MGLKIVLIFALAAATSVVDCDRPTHCERWKGDREFRCGKDGYRADHVTVRNRADNNVSFKAGFWMSSCGWPGQNYADHSHSLAPGGRMDIPFGEVRSGTCNELYIYDCKINNRGANCLDTVIVSAN